jgi:hypothetical protein
MAYPNPLLPYSHQMGAYFSVVDGTMNETDGLEVNYPDVDSEEVPVNPPVEHHNVEGDDAESNAQVESAALSSAPLLLRVLFELKLASLGVDILFS